VPVQSLEEEGGGNPILPFTRKRRMEVIPIPETKKKGKSGISFALSRRSGSKERESKDGNLDDCENRIGAVTPFVWKEEGSGFFSAKKDAFSPRFFDERRKRLSALAKHGSVPCSRKERRENGGVHHGGESIPGIFSDEGKKNRGGNASARC